MLAGKVLLCSSISEDRLGCWGSFVLIERPRRQRWVDQTFPEVSSCRRHLCFAEVAAKMCDQTAIARSARCAVPRFLSTPGPRGRIAPVPSALRQTRSPSVRQGVCMGPRCSRSLRRSEHRRYRSSNRHSVPVPFPLRAPDRLAGPTSLSKLNVERPQHGLTSRN